MHIVDTAEFYTQALGKATHELLGQRLRNHLPQASDAVVLGLGYASPFLSPEGRHLSFMMARGGAVHWPQQGAVKSALIDELALPLSDNSVDVALLIHALEFSESAEDLLGEVWRGAKAVMPRQSVLRTCRSQVPLPLQQDWIAQSRMPRLKNAADCGVLELTHSRGRRQPDFL